MLAWLGLRSRTFLSSSGDFFSFLWRASRRRRRRLVCLIPHGPLRRGHSCCSFSLLPSLLRSIFFRFASCVLCCTIYRRPPTGRFWPVDRRVVGRLANWLLSPAAVLACFWQEAWPRKFVETGKTVCVSPACLSAALRQHLHSILFLLLRFFQRIEERVRHPNRKCSRSLQSDQAHCAALPL